MELLKRLYVKNSSFKDVRMADIYIICEEEDQNLTECRDAKFWSTLHNVAVIRKYKTILDVAVNEMDSLKFLLSIIGHMEQILHVRKAFKTGRHQMMLALAPKSKLEKHKNVSQGSSSIIEPDRCIFCKKTKYKAESITREKTHSCLEFRSDKKVRDSALLHIK